MHNAYAHLLSTVVVESGMNLDFLVRCGIAPEMPAVPLPLSCTADDLCAWAFPEGRRCSDEVPGAELKEVAMASELHLGLVSVPTVEALRRTLDRMPPWLKVKHCLLAGATSGAPSETLFMGIRPKEAAAALAGGCVDPDLLPDICLFHLDVIRSWIASGRIEITAWDWDRTLRDCLCTAASSGIKINTERFQEIEDTIAKTQGWTPSTRLRQFMRRNSALYSDELRRSNRMEESKISSWKRHSGPDRNHLSHHQYKKHPY